MPRGGCLCHVSYVVDSQTKWLCQIYAHRQRYVTQYPDPPASSHASDSANDSESETDFLKEKPIFSVPPSSYRCGQSNICVSLADVVRGSKAFDYLPPWVPKYISFFSNFKRCTVLKYVNTWGNVMPSLIVVATANNCTAIATAVVTWLVWFLSPGFCFWQWESPLLCFRSTTTQGMSM